MNTLARLILASLYVLLASPPNNRHNPSSDRWTLTREEELTDDPGRSNGISTEASFIHPVYIDVYMYI